jgi:hypothetical protein
VGIIQGKLPGEHLLSGELSGGYVSSGKFSGGGIIGGEHNQGELCITPWELPGGKSPQRELSGWNYCSGELSFWGGGYCLG